ncbi:MAG TPA: SEC-C metal-binding domain-containing protein [Oligoflexus sp.]|uniref:YecA family protein n=1 Tax=Oligoflexus sp. TaxID=1971216 RepID=UPI002D58DD42|nr:SEC-C metal-binding domain-containing protein [Oligoflexus sp.]HYX39355.1 SEC-C metal-binding domain-containing protein [Oligoflexus sp.]
MKAGRNDPCPCGSGEKYKKCCFVKESATRSDDVLFREAEAALMERMLPFAEEAFGENAIEQAWVLFLDELTEVAFDPEDPLNLLFIPWFLFNWVIEAGDQKPSPQAPMNKTVAEVFMKTENASALELDILQASNRRPLSFFEVLEVDSGRSLKLQDLMQDNTLTVEEDTASQTLKPGEIIIGSIMLPIKGRIRPLTVGPFALPERCKEDVTDLRVEILEKTGSKSIDEALLHQEEAFTIGLYLDLLDEVLEESYEDDEEEDDDEDGEDEER